MPGGIELQGPSGEPLVSDRLHERPADRGTPRPARTWSDVPWRSIVATVGVVSVALVAGWLIWISSRIMLWTAIAGFFALVLSPAVRWCERHLRVRRGLAVAMVVVVFIGSFIGMLALFIVPISDQLPAALSDLPKTVSSAAEGQGPVGNLVTRLNLEDVVKDNQDALQKWARSVNDSGFRILGAVFSTVLACVTIAVITCLFLTQGPALADAARRAIPARHRERVTAVGLDASRAISGYMIGNLVISVFAGTAAFVLLLILGVPNAALLALWVAFADLIPLVGATIGAAVAVIAALLHSPTAGIVALVFFVVYQQFENGVLQVVVMSRTVKVNPLVVILSVLFGVELLGFVGALLAIPAAGAIQVVAKGIWVARPREVELATVGDDIEVIRHELEEGAVAPPKEKRFHFRLPIARLFARSQNVKLPPSVTKG